MSRSSTNIRVLARLLGHHKPQEGAMRSFSTASPVHAHEKEGKVLHPHLLNENVLKTEYAVRGELYLRAEQLRKEGKEIMFTNGRCHASIEVCTLIASVLACINGCLRAHFLNL